MTKNEFLLKFALNHSADSVHKYRHKTPLRQAAVLIPLIDDGKELSVVLTQRALHLKHHAGQISFPGGKVEDNDKDLVYTALRETHEEIGVPPQSIEVVGSLHSYQVISGFVVTPYVGFIPHNFNYIKDKNEVSEIFQVPLTHFLNDDNHIAIPIQRKDYSHNVHFMPYQNYNIWGATAAMLKDLAIHIN